MNRPILLGTMGGQKAGKTHFAATLFQSTLFPPDRVLYLDNHGSTDPFDLPQWSTTSRWGVKHIPSDKPRAVMEELVEVKKARTRGRTPFDAIVIDDWSEFAQADIDDLLGEGSDASRPRHWGEHGEKMRDVARLVHPRVTGAHHIAIFQAAQLPDPMQTRPKKVVDGELKYTADTRRTFIQPFLQGNFAGWFPYKLDALFYQFYTERGGRLEFKMRFVPRGDIHVFSRWLHLWQDNPKLPQEMADPTFDKVVTLLQGGVAASNEEGENTNE